MASKTLHALEKITWDNHVCNVDLRLLCVCKEFVPVQVQADSHFRNIGSCALRTVTFAFRLLAARAIVGAGAPFEDRKNIEDVLFNFLITLVWRHMAIYCFSDRSWLNSREVFRQLRESLLNVILGQLPGRLATGRALENLLDAIVEPLYKISN